MGLGGDEKARRTVPTMRIKTINIHRVFSFSIS
jgi:hypothetical protein